MLTLGAADGRGTRKGTRVRPRQCAATRCRLRPPLTTVPSAVPMVYTVQNVDSGQLTLASLAKVYR